MERFCRGLLLIASLLVLTLPARPQAPAPVLWSVTSFGENDFFQSPSDIEIDGARSLIYVVDAGSARVLVFDFEGRYLKAIGRKGQGPGEFVRPTGAGLVQGGGLAVADVGANRIEIFDRAGTFVRLVHVTEARVADLIQAGGRFYTIPSFGQSGYVVTAGSDAKSQPLVSVLDEEGRRVQTITSDEFPEPHPFIRAIKHRVCLALSPRGRLYLAYFAANLIQVFEPTGEKAGSFARPLPFKPRTPELIGERSPVKGIVQMRAEIDFVSPAAAFGPDGKLYVLTVTEAAAQIRKTNPDLKGPYPMRIDVIDARTFEAVRTIPCDPGVKAFAVLDGGRLVYVCEDAEGELALKCVRY